MTRIVYLDMIGGASGDMLLGALVGAGLALPRLRAELKKVPAAGYAISAEKVRRGAVDATLVRIEIDADGDPPRTWDVFARAISESKLPLADKTTASRIFQTLRDAEKAAHSVGRPLPSSTASRTGRLAARAEKARDARLHELGSVDTLVDVLGTIIGLRLLRIDRVHASAFPASSGISKSSHGAGAATAPATRHIYLAKRVPVRAGGQGAPIGEAVTPTGAAIIATLADFRPASFTVEKVGYGAGQRDPEGYPNVLGLWLGEAFAEEHQAVPHVILSGGQGVAAAKSDRSQPGHRAGNAAAILSLSTDGSFGASLRGGLTLLETNIDDMPGELFGFVQERLFQAGALDVWFTPIQMKKNRPGVLLSALVPESGAQVAAGIILRETSTLGVRTRPVERYEAERETLAVKTTFGPIPVKLKRLGVEIVDASPEYEACREASLRTGVPLQEVMRRAQSEALTKLQGKRR
jgi:uncharacterized protein (TIGR00299 family) protein